MRCLERNKRTFYYATWRGKEYVEVNGVKTGDLQNTYNEPVQIRASISTATSMTSASRGAFSDTAPYGSVLNYDRRIVIDDLSCPLDENSVLSVYCEPNYDSTTHTLTYDHEVIKKEVGLEYLTYYIKRLS